MRRGFTLMELMLVLTILVILVSLAMPILRGPLMSFRLRAAADQVRADWASVRVRAMESGQTLMFRFTPGSNHYCICCVNTADSMLGSPGGTAYSAVGSPGMDTMSASSDSSLVTELNSSTDGVMQTRFLPEGVAISGAQIQIDPLSGTPQQSGMFSLGTMGATNDSSLQQYDADTVDSAQGIEQSVYFYPDGTTSTAMLTLVNEKQHMIRVTMRGQTGLVNVGKSFVN